MNKERLITLTLVILIAAASRLLPHPPNVAPIAAIALFAGAQFDRRWLAFAVPLAALLISDAVIGFYPQMWVTYLAFAMIVGIGFMLRGRQRLVPIAVATLSSSVLFFLITNNAFLQPNLYPPTMGGMMESYAAGIPFFRNTLFGDAFYVALLFGGFALAERKFAWLKASQPATA